MSLAGRKIKQRIGADPRNLTWGGDAAKFGQQYLAKLGWDSSRGLGVLGDGRTSHIKVAQKLNLLGIGAGNAKMGDDTVAWKQSRDYEMLLKRLNEGMEADQRKQEGKQEGGKETDEKEDAEDESVEKKRKRKDDAKYDADDDKNTKKRKKEKKRKLKDKGKDREVEKIEEEQDDEDTKASSNLTITESASPVVQAPVPRPMAHRARFLRSKQLASRSSTAVAEILGISSSSNTPGPSSLSGTSTPFPIVPESTEKESPTPVPETNHDLRTSSTSVGDYFKEKLAARALTNASASDRSKSSTPRSSQSASLSTPSSSTTRPSETSAPPIGRAEVAKNVSRSEDDGETPRAGLGSKAGRAVAIGTHDDGEPPRVGLSAKFGGLIGGFSSLKPAENSASTLPKNEDSPHPQPSESSEASRTDESSVKRKKKKHKAEDGKREKKRKKAKEVVSERTDDDADVQPVVEDKAPTESDCQNEKGIAQDSAERREKKKKKRKDNKRKRQEDGSK